MFQQLDFRYLVDFKIRVNTLIRKNTFNLSFESNERSFLNTKFFLILNGITYHKFTELLRWSLI